MKDSLVKLFMELVAIPSPSGHESAVAAYIQKYLKQHDVAHEFDSTQNDSDTGNLIARLSGDSSLPALLFVAHMDTVETGEKSIVPRLKNGILTSDGTTVLGADDKAAVAALLEALSEVRQDDRRPNIVVVFTTREERGVMGSRLLNLFDKIDFAFNIDGAGMLGDFAYEMLGAAQFTVTLHGKAAHAANNPEAGANALLAAGHILTTLPIGKTERGTVLNIGTIRAGTADNIVPDKAILTGEARAYTQEESQELMAEIEKIVSAGASSHGCTYEFTVDEAASPPPASQSTDHPIVEFAKRGAEHAGLSFQLTRLSATSDANYISTHYPTLNMCRGGKNPHGFNESIDVETLHGIKQLILSLIREAARR